MPQHQGTAVAELHGEPRRANKFEAIESAYGLPAHIKSASIGVL